MTRIQSIALAGVLLTVVASAAFAQNTTQSDIQRLQDNVYLADRDVSQLRGRDAARANQIQDELDELRDEVIYLKVKLRKERSLARTEYTDVRDRIDNLRSRARGEGASQYTFNQPAPTPAPVPTPTPVPAPAPSRPAATTGATGSSTTGAGSATGGGTSTARTTTPTRNASEISSGTEIDIRLSNTLNSGTAQVEDRFEGTSLVDLVLDGRVLVPAGAIFRGVVSGVEPATRTNRTARLTVSFDQMTVSGRAYPIRGTVTQAIEGEGVRGEAARVGAGAGVGAIIGGLLGGFKGAMAGILIGGGGTIAATEGKEVELPQGSVLRMRFDSPVTVQLR
jgi:TolA-binding protein